jgi:hypothetical protein
LFPGESRRGVEPSVWYSIAFCEAEQRFLLLFLEKEELLAMFNEVRDCLLRSRTTLFASFFRKKKNYKRRI